MTSSLRIRVGAACAGLALALGGAALVAPAAHAAQVGTLTIDPAKGNDQSVVRVSTDKPCPSGATNVIVKVYGKGFPSAGQNVVGNSPLTAYVPTAAGGVVVPLQLTLLDFTKLQTRPVALSGSYRFVLTCRQNIKAASMGDFVGTMAFNGTANKSGARNFVAANPAPAPVPGASQPPSGSGSSKAAPKASASPGQQTPAPSGAAAGATPAATAPAGTNAADSASTSSTPWFAVILIGLAVIALGAGGVLYLRGRSSGTGESR